MEILRSIKNNKNRDTIDESTEIKKGRSGFLAIAAAGTMILAGCATEADTVSENLSTAAEEFEIDRRIVFLNGITDEVPLVIEGKCSIEADTADEQLEVVCKKGPDAYEKHFL